MADRPRSKLASGEDVSEWSDRELLVRAVNGVLETNDAVGRLAATVADIDRRYHTLEARVSKLERRPAMPSAHDLAKELAEPIAEAVEDAVEKTNPNLKLRSDSERVRAAIVARENELLADQARTTKKATSKLWLTILGLLAAGLLERIIEATAKGHW